MARAGAPNGNENAFQGKLVRQAILNALGSKSRAGALVTLNQIMSKVAEKALNGDLESAKFLADRIDGKAAQSVELSTPNGLQIEASNRPTITQVEWLRLHGVAST